MYNGCCPTATLQHHYDYFLTSFTAITIGSWPTPAVVRMSQIYRSTSIGTPEVTGKRVLMQSGFKVGVVILTVELIV